MPHSLPSARHRFEARRAAEAYAPTPKNSVAMYGFCGMALASLAMVAFGAYYGMAVDTVAVVAPISALAGGTAGVGLYLIRRLRHLAALDSEHALIRSSADTGRAATVQLPGVAP